MEKQHRQHGDVQNQVRHGNNCVVRFTTGGGRTPRRRKSNSNKPRKILTQGSLAMSVSHSRQVCDCISPSLFISLISLISLLGIVMQNLMVRLQQFVSPKVSRERITVCRCPPTEVTTRRCELQHGMLSMLHPFLALLDTRKVGSTRYF